MQLAVSLRKMLWGIGIAAMLTGCGGGGGSNSVPKSEIKSEQIKVESIDVVDTNDLEAGRPVSMDIGIRNTQKKSMTILYVLVPAESYDNNQSDERGINVFYDTFVPVIGDNTRSVKTILPTDLATGTYRMIAIYTPESYYDKNSDHSIESIMNKYPNLFSISKPFTIVANDGKPDIEINSIRIEAADSEAGETETKRSKPSVLTFDVGIVGESVILNSRGISFLGAIGIDDYIAEAHNITMSICIDYGEGCKAVEIYSVDENNQTHYDTDSLIETVQVNQKNDVHFNGVIRGKLLDDLAKNVIKDDTLVPTIKVSLGGIEESATQDPEKNSIEAMVKFVPVILSRTNIDNTYDRIAPALSDYQLTLHDYLNDIKKIDPGYSVSDDGIHLFNPGLEWNTDDLIGNAVLTNPSFTPFQDGIIKVEPITSVSDFELIKPNVIPEPNGIDTKNDPINDIHAVSDVVSQLSMKDGINSILLHANTENLANETVNEKVFYGEFIPLELSSKYLGIRGKLSGESRFDRNGVRFFGYAGIEAYVVDDWYQIIGVDAYSSAIPANLYDSGYQMTLKFLGQNVWTTANNIADEHGLKNSEAKDIHQRIRENVDKVDNLYYGALGDGGGGGWADKTEQSDTVWVCCVPIAYTLGASGSLNIHMGGYTRDLGFLDVTFVAGGDFKAYGRGGVGVEYDGYGASAGVEGYINLIKDNITISGRAGIKYVGDDTNVYSFIGELEEVAWNEYFPPNGGMNFYAHVTGLGWHRKPIWHIGSDPIKSTILNKHQTLFKINF